jgi:hypothetical protein
VTAFNGHGVELRRLAWWKHAAGDGDSHERSRRLIPYVEALFDFHLGPPVPMSNRELRQRWRALIGDRHVA